MEIYKFQDYFKNKKKDEYEKSRGWQVILSDGQEAKMIGNQGGLAIILTKDGQKLYLGDNEFKFP